MLKINDIAERCEVSRQTVQTWIEAGELPAIDVAPAGSKRKFLRIEQAALEQFLESRASGGSVVLPVATGHYLT